jgi:hypothetical protein
MAKAIRPADLGDAIADALTLYSQEVTEEINRASEEAVKTLAKKTKATAPVASGSYKKNISSKLLKKGERGDTYVWYVKAPDHRLTHLLVHGHATRNGGRTKKNPFLQNALDEVLPDYEKAIEEAVQHG